MHLIHLTRSSISRFTHIFPSSSYGSFKESGTPITSKYSIMFTRGIISTHLTRDIVENPAAARTQRSGFRFHANVLVGHESHGEIVYNHPLRRLMKDWFQQSPPLQYIGGGRVWGPLSGILVCDWSISSANPGAVVPALIPNLSLLTNTGLIQDNLFNLTSQ